MSYRKAANNTGGKWSRPALIATNAEPQTVASARKRTRSRKRLISAVSSARFYAFRFETGSTNGIEKDRTLYGMDGRCTTSCVTATLEG
ncbi:hypothetical protein C477_13230 [Haloterrigena salina JCM 13891]|uniref:Uncharacterized protein n=1 Tax=Haloterrigena salina JCM 13891 TaxID=1227488 RepID=M0C5I7_9EURY|nr:hypothetical protein C477_13230 [Haloterrigena salina JCM 13891]